MKTFRILIYKMDMNDINQMLFFWGIMDEWCFVHPLNEWMNDWIMFLKIQYDRHQTYVSDYDGPEPEIRRDGIDAGSRLSGKYIELSKCAVCVCLYLQIRE